MASIDPTTNKFCCTCLKSEEYNLKKINTTTNDSIRLMEMIFYLMEYPTDKCEDKDNEYYGRQICKTCEKNLILAYSFKKQVEVSNKELCAMHNHIKMEIETVTIKKEKFCLDNSNDNKIPPTQLIDNINSENILKDEENILKNILNYDTLINTHTNDSSSIGLNSSKNSFELIDDTLMRDVEENIKCLKCDTTFLNFSDYYTHCTVIHSSSTLKPEDDDLLIPEKQFENLPVLKKKYHNECEKDLEMKGHDATSKIDLKKFECTLCDKKFKIKSSLNRHARQWHKETEKPLNDIKHKKRIENPAKRKAKLILCSQCGKTIFSSKMKEHMNVHANCRYKCTECEKSFKFSSALNVHMRNHRNEKRYECEYCGEKFLIWGSRRNHIRAYHTDQKYSICCTICDRKFTQRSGMLTHIRIAHTHEKPYQCDQCEKTFSTSALKQKHKLVHSNVRNFSCDICSNTFKCKKSLTAHIKIHTGEKNYVCPACSKAFIHIQVLRSHMRIHPELTIPPPGTILSQKFLNKEKQNTNTTISLNMNKEEF